MKNIVFMGYGEIGQSVRGLYSNEKNEYLLHALDPKLKTPTISNNTQDISNIRPLNSSKILKVSKTLFTNVSKVTLVTLRTLVTKRCNTLTGVKTLTGCDTINCNCNNIINNDFKVEVLHVAIPFTKNFVKDVTKTMKDLKPKMTIIHSTINVGTTKKIFEKTGMVIVHSPVMGKHPDLTESILTFNKIIGPTTNKSYNLVNKHLTSLGVTTQRFTSSNESEAAKLFCTTSLQHDISYMRHVKRYCDKYGLDFENVYTGARTVYNNGWQSMGHPEYTRPVLKFTPGKTGGHCLVSNLNILKNKFSLAKILLKEERNKSLTQ